MQWQDFGKTVHVRLMSKGTQQLQNIENRWLGANKKNLKWSLNQSIEDIKNFKREARFSGPKFSKNILNRLDALKWFFTIAGANYKTDVMKKTIGQREQQCGKGLNVKKMLQM